ncbi:peptide chain release factor N(5)-glutamine methyltransferase [Methylocella sp. CPCC 101449]|uniref:peptide chain release factor N(5)-glutamine methyltransferase n=1 Tax=Methylocella sp. CPCC 101449 TaxID=2987531 RepID=UPI00288EEDDB|nr:peptide chain release factor N(5)-glutamine methyltransferase [Methylocella sp. CPCC 101449]MDT2020497.1 peptide chain release factor N(5)-glutamine methyltransferase [Methylocella sp. CPCC 101449]
MSPAARALTQTLRAQPSMAAVLDRIAEAFAAAGIDTARLDARLLLSAATGIDAAGLLARMNDPLDETALDTLIGFVTRRLDREPVSRILGSRGFWTLDLAISPDVLDPRPDTETLVQAAVTACRARRDEPLRILDLCTGSGAILAALLSEFPNATGLGTDISPAACAIARQNLEATGLAARGEIRIADWADGIVGPFDLVVSNPPYIETSALAGLDPEVRHFDPQLALDGGPDGLTAYRAIATALPKLLATDGDKGRGLGTGLVFLEIGAAQAADVSAIVEAAGLTHIEVIKDFGGRDRVVWGRGQSEGERANLPLGRRAKTD